MNVLSFVECERCGQMFKQRSSDAKYCSVSCSSSTGRVCAWCGTKEISKVRFANDYCSEECYVAHHTKQCEICNNEFIAVPLTRKFCSIECSDESARRRSLQASMDVHNGVCICLECGSTFKREYGDKRRHCSNTCKRKRTRRDKRNYKAKRRAQKKNAGTVERIDSRMVFKRDNWTCGICGEKIDRRTKFPHPRCAVLDHIIPLARGGTHTWNNVQCAHNECNGRKSDKQIGQLRLDIRVWVSNS